MTIHRIDQTAKIIAIMSLLVLIGLMSGFIRVYGGLAPGVVIGISEECQAGVTDLHGLKVFGYCE